MHWIVYFSFVSLFITTLADPKEPFPTCSATRYLSPRAEDDIVFKIQYSCNAMSRNSSRERQTPLLVDIQLNTTVVYTLGNQINVRR